MQVLRRDGIKEIVVNDNGEIEEKIGFGRYLSTWNAEKGEPETLPGKIPYRYVKGDYYVIGKEGNRIPGGKMFHDNWLNYDRDSSVIKTGRIFIFNGVGWDRL